jgi:hypothetical protein
VAGGLLVESILCLPMDVVGVDRHTSGAKVFERLSRCLQE